ncbi:MAG: peptide chain release factor-like protein [Verrucomicrobia bacterium]|nr:peptide chain release factor-like protein [Verrucomicrobiota bacterium]
MGITKEKEEGVRRQMLALGIREEDLIEKFILGSGRGGQNLQKTSSCVYLKHIPTGIEVKCQKDRSQAVNRILARRLLCEAIKERIQGEKSKKQHEIEKIRRQKRRRSRKQKQKMLEGKKMHGEKKALRAKISS